MKKIAVDTRALLCLLALPVSCSPDPSPTRAAAVDKASPATRFATPAVDYAGRWTGVEGMVLDVTRGAAPGRYRLAMQYDLDHHGTYDARLEGDALSFERDGKRLMLRPTDGTATALKYLEGKRDCLTVVPGEGYCRD